VTWIASRSTEEPVHGSRANYAQGMRRARAFLARAAAVTAALAAAAAPAGGAQQVGTWRVTGAPLSANVGPTATLADGRVLALYTVTENEYGPGSLPGTRIVVGERRHLASEFYDPRSRTWIAGPSPPGEEASTLVALPGGGGPLLLGETACERQPWPGRPSAYLTVCRPIQATYRLNGGGSEWTLAPAMLTRRTRPGVARLRDGRILVAGGSGASCTAQPPVLALGSDRTGVRAIQSDYSCAPLSSAEVFDPAGGRWTATAPMPSAAVEPSVTALSDGTVLLLHGQPRDAARFDPLRDTWTPLAPPPEPLGGDLLPLPGDRAIALGGRSRRAFIAARPAPLRAIECDTPQIYSARTGKWTTAPPPPGPANQPLRGCIGGAVELAAGDILAPQATLIDHQRCWVTTGLRASGTDEGLLIPLLDGGALAINASYPSPTAEIYAPAPGRCTAAQLTRANLFGHITPRGGVVTPRRLLSRGYPLVVRTARPGDVRINWYLTSQTSEGTNRVLIADGGARSSADRAVKITMRLTPKGELELAEQMSVEAQGVFAARGSRPLIVLRDFTIEERAGRQLVP
jgi:hypothetical protein